MRLELSTSAGMGSYAGRTSGGRRRGRPFVAKSVCHVGEGEDSTGQGVHEVGNQVLTWV